eukprot:5180735-Alexandrium_andersonii.AAC.1
MSASLVGSEMCIRDSEQSGMGARCRRPAGPQASRATELLASCPVPLPCPVSYTHLTLPTICSV